VEAMTEEIKVGRIDNGTVSSVKDFGAFIEIAPGRDGLCHVSEFSTDDVKSFHEIRKVKVGEKLQVKVIAIDDQNRVKLSRKAVLAEHGEGAGDEPRSAFPIPIWSQCLAEQGEGEVDEPATPEAGNFINE
jgi:polyribonucleotide nucleotidyltransferase